ncbi:hypothetical protein [Streptomyces barringtoniae]|uniref:hypothetical protein n=1 Tax=Streptomyces barringtoniae TaxID=2892029 RepID=UPI001E62DAC4|nr:hypothetical protein [Streptomyces barringtoniae]MCC5477469.1 hypothetical protein [Streptomyces barringtoniae]
MPRPTAAQLVYGSCTVIFSTLAMLLLSQTSSGLGVTVIALAALALGLLVAMTVPLPKVRTTEATTDAPAEAPAEERPVRGRGAEPAPQEQPVSTAL